MNIMGNVLDILGRFIIPVIIFYLLWTIFNIIRDYRRYGNKIFAAFKKYEETGKAKDIIINILDQECLTKPIIISKNDNSLIVLTEKEIYGIVVLEFEGKLTGKVMDKYLILNNKNKKNNPLCKFTNDLKNIKKKNINIFPIVIKNGRNNEIEIEGLPDSRIMTIKDFSYYIYKNQSAEQKYTIDELKKYSKTIGKIVNGHN